jgi:hypothetical protein
MANRQLTDDEREAFVKALLAEVRARLLDLADRDQALHWALERQGVQGTGLRQAWLADVPTRT